MPNDSESDEFLRVTIVGRAEGADAPPPEGVVVALRLGEAVPDLEAEFEEESDPAPPLDEDVVVRVHGEPLVDPLAIHARVAGPSERIELDGGGVHVRYRFLIEPPSAGALARATNRRRTVRVQPLDVLPVEVALVEAGSVPIPVEIFDLSATGIALILRDADVVRRFTQRRVAFALKLPNGEGWYEMVGRVRYRKRAETGTLLGLEYDEELTPTYKSKQAALIGFVTDVQRELFRRARDGGEPAGP